MRQVVNSVAGLDTALFGLPDDMKVEVAPDIAVSAQTVRDLRALDSLACKLLLRWPWPRLPEHAVAVVAPRLLSHGFCASLDEAKAKFAETWRG